MVLGLISHENGQAIGLEHVDFHFLGMSPWIMCVSKLFMRPFIATRMMVIFVSADPIGENQYAAIF